MSGDLIEFPDMLSRQNQSDGRMPLIRKTSVDNTESSRPGKAPHHEYFIGLFLRGRFYSLF